MRAARTARRAAASFLLLLAAAAAAADVARPPAAIAALRLVMLGERMAKLHAQLGQGVLVQRSRRDLAQAERDFEAGLRAAASQPASAEARENSLLLAALWREHREWLARPPTREHAREMRTRTEEIVWVAQKGARMLQGESRAPVNAGAFRAAQAEVLSQRLAKAHLWRRWGMRDERLQKEARDSDENLKRLLAALHETRGNTPDIEAELQSADTQLKFLRESARELDTGRSAQSAIEFVAKAADHIREAMERVERLYDAAPASAGS
jgi:hypothetical protein